MQETGKKKRFDRQNRPVLQAGAAEYYRMYSITTRRFGSVPVE